ncbi:MAG: hypothetical protein MZV64_29515 [Ignavibacteriales bacterium]|nr:hypothetical protein [Ignavibacteriales bacterium]
MHQSLQWLYSEEHISNKKWAAFLVPLVAMFITDLVIGFHETMWAVYLSFALIVGLGITMLKEKKIGSIFFASVISSSPLFIITNFGIWRFQPDITQGAGAGVSSLLYCSNSVLPSNPVE